MISPIADFPTRSHLWRGVVLVTIEHALWEAPLGFRPDHQWPNPHNYVMDYESGDLGVITFRENLLVAAFFAHDQSRSPFSEAAGSYDIERYFVGMPAHLRSIANADTLQYLLLDLDGVIQPVITAAFWGEGERLTAAEPWGSVWVNGAYQLRVQLMDPDDAIQYIRFRSNLSPEEYNEQLIRSIFERRMAQQGGEVVLTEAERDAFLAKGSAGIEESRQLLAAIGIILA